MRKISCDNCRTSKGKIWAPFLTLWNGNEIDLCVVCADNLGLREILDGIRIRMSKREQA